MRYMEEKKDGWEEGIQVGWRGREVGPLFKRHRIKDGKNSWYLFS